MGFTSNRLRVLSVFIAPSKNALAFFFVLNVVALCWALVMLVYG